MDDIQKRIDLDIDLYGPLKKYVTDMNVTDVEWESKMLWITDLVKGRYRVMDHKVTEAFEREFCTNVSNRVNCEFNQANPKLEAETEEWRIVLLHESIISSGKVIVLRRITAIKRHSIESMLETNYCQAEIIALLINAVKSRINFNFIGLPGAGKSELLKWATTFIRPNDKAIMVEDSPEIHYGDINPGYDYIPFKVGKHMSYSDAVKQALRLTPKWLMITESRGEEINDVRTAWKTNISGMVTGHCGDLRSLPDRYSNMSGDTLNVKQFEDDVYAYAGIAVLIERRPAEPGQIDYDENLAPRYIDQVCVYAREFENEHGNNLMNKVYMIVEGGKIVSHELPEWLKKKMIKFGIVEPYRAPEVQEVLEREKKERE